METIHEIIPHLHMSPGEFVVSMASNRGALFVVTNYGKLFRIDMPYLV